MSLGLCVFEKKNPVYQVFLRFIISDKVKTQIRVEPGKSCVHKISNCSLPITEITDCSSKK